MCRKFNNCDSLLFENVRIRDIVVCPFSTIFTTQMDWWQLINFYIPDNEFRVVRNLYRSVFVSRITLRWKGYPQKSLQNNDIGRITNNSLITHAQNATCVSSRN